MKTVLASVVALLLIVGMAVAADKKDAPTTAGVQPLAKSGEKTQALPRVVLPNVRVLAKRMWKVDRSLAAVQQRKSATVLAFFDGKGKWLRATRHKKCWEVPWQRSCTVARATYRLHKKLGQIATRRLMFEIPTTDNWVRAMRYAQRPFPGTLDWLEFISNRECRACWTTPGGFICNYQGSGACGPMQFMSGTFYGYVDDARRALKAQGFIVSDSVWSWRNPLGQALTAAYMRYTSRDGCHWCL